ncbi:TenA family transcriptional regulator [Tenacibaculum caenipelagi]|uniref:Thiaminase/transcriptional activator TenA n=1 Tax=Tenacibaculum caenipelagi TaxID=1325435 RepID=A0A4R6TBY9_9FLAO|nr:TenA family transcriptional regulator [Tenacibaculum caenipelagi]TDQ23894.1 thiaminase/transcriptional activator TenA [Tenacibaculum caenipelagi]
MKNNRSTKLDQTFLTEYKLSTAPPPTDTLFWKMWNACQDIANETLNTQFIQEIKSGTLNPVHYGGFNISDAYYCFKGAQDYLNAMDRASNPTLKAFLHKKYNSYQKYNDTFPKTWRIKDAEGIIPSEVCKLYSKFESMVASHQDPIYALIVMIPCEYLWAWLAAQLSPTSSKNLYAPWITGNNDPNGAYAMGNFLEEYQKENPVDEKLATQLYTQAITYEYQNFNTALSS